MLNTPTPFTLCYRNGFTHSAAIDMTLPNALKFAGLVFRTPNETRVPVSVILSPSVGRRTDEESRRHDTLRPDYDGTPGER